MKTLSANHIVVDPCDLEQLKNNQGKLYFHVGSRLQNGVIRKRKVTHIGWIVKTIKPSKWAFAPSNLDRCFCQETLEIVTNIVKDLNEGKVKYDVKKGDWIINGKL